MSIGYRVLLYIAAFIALTVYVVWAVIADSKANLSNDPSSTAWMAFLPYFLPIFAAQAFIWVAPVAAVIEAVLAVWRWWK